ncbi:phosphotransferase [Saccharothrix sp. S26]|uniref:phosphotransferase family protein n=1 Tax=Saccharothrix sp. S26 TaxID=2907215 RepID=UPI001F2EC40F|nr:phosphotransferase [Saccharothrix sp. S26]MCE6995980.1 phosphotransferase [Saccharothrix sp. S26]
MTSAPRSPTAREVATIALGRDPGPLEPVRSLSHRVFVGADVVVKLTDHHTRLDREVALLPQLPDGITAPLLAGGRRDGVRYACYQRVPGASPGIHLPHADAATARTLAVQAVERLDRLHAWQPGPSAAEILRRPSTHGGFTSREALREEIDRLRAADRDGLVSRRVITGLTAIADHAPERAGTDVPVHGDCYWDNWLADGDTITALLDFEWARFGEPTDDWFFLIRFSGPHTGIVLDVVASATGIPADVLRADCEVREAGHVVTDVRLGLENDPAAGVGTIGDLEQLVIGRFWWRDTWA